MSIIAKFYPNGEFSQGVDTSRTRRDKQRRHKDCRDKNWRQRRDEYLRYTQEFPQISCRTCKFPLGTKFVSRSGYQYELVRQETDGCSLRWRDGSGASHESALLQSIGQVCWQWGLIPLVYQTLESCEKPKSRKKLEKMTSQMSRNIRNGVFLLERMPGGKDCLSFLTLTLPNLSSKALDDCCRNWDKMVKRFFDWLRTRLEKRNMRLQHVYCTEIQQKRLQKTHDYAPHLHVVFRGRNAKKDPWVVTPKQVRKAWVRCIRSVTTEQFTQCALENIQRIKYSAARYLAKYLGKSSRTVPNDTEVDVQSSLHTQWGGMSRDISRLIKQNTRRITDTGWYGAHIRCFIGTLDYLHKLGYVSYYTTRVINICEAGVETFGFGLIVRCGALSIPTVDGGLQRIFDFFEQVLGIDK